MILADTSIWIQHFKTYNADLANMLNTDDVLMHPFVMGELAMGNLAARQSIFAFLATLNEVVLASNDEVLRFVEQYKLFGIGIGLVDAHLLASVRLTHEALIWTHDKRLHAAASQLRLASSITQ